MEDLDKKILVWLADGLTAAVIAEECGISKRAIEKRIEIIKAASDAKNVANLIAIALRNKLIE